MEGRIDVDQRQKKSRTPTQRKTNLHSLRPPNFVKKRRKIKRVKLNCSVLHHLPPKRAMNRKYRGWRLTEINKYPLADQSR
uniref:Uncharacterized protein n=1 Tax=Cucumis melo TaxID=3656 RepID=A0A9I9DBR8_CUCME